MYRFVKITAAGAIALGVGLGLTVAAYADHHESGHSSGSAQAPKDIVETATAAGQFKTLTAALQAAGLVETLKGKGPFTVFAPNDAAFAKLPDGTLQELLEPENKEKLAAILTYHVVPAKAMAEDVAGMSSAKTVNGKEVKLKAENGKVTVDNATVVKADIPASNGVIHVIDSVLMP